MPIFVNPGPPEHLGGGGPLPTASRALGGKQLKGLSVLGIKWSVGAGACGAGRALRHRPLGTRLSGLAEFLQ